jgi:class 3 adenylate cyclase
VIALGSDRLRALIARLLGWSDQRAVDLALHSLGLAVEHRATLTLSGDGDMVPIAQALHRRTLGAAKPFIVCDPRRATSAASTRSPANRTSGVAAFEAAIGGSLCLRTPRLPKDFPALVDRLRGSDDVLCVLCTGALADPQPRFILPAPLTVPPLIQRSAELDRIIDEYAGDAIAEMFGSASSFTADDHAWVKNHAAASFAEIETSTLRLVTLRTSRNMSHAATRLRMAPVSLSRWLGRRKLRH